MSLIKPAVLNPEDLDLNAERTPIPSPNEPSSFFKEVTKLFDELLREYRTTLSIRAYGQEVEWEMLAWMRARLKEDLVSKSEVCFLSKHPICSVSQKFSEYSTPSRRDHDRFT